MKTMQMLVPSEQDIVLVENHFAWMLEQEVGLATLWLEQLPEQAPQINTLLYDARETDGNKLLAAMISVVQNLRQPLIIKEYFQTLEEHHLQQAELSGITEEFIASWLTLLTHLEEANHAAALHTAWQSILGYLSALMLSVRNETDIEDAVVSVSTVNEPTTEYHKSETPPELSDTPIQHDDLTSALSHILHRLDDTLFEQNLLAFNLTLESNRPEHADPKLQHVATDMRQNTQQAMQLLSQLRQKLEK